MSFLKSISDEIYNTTSSMNSLIVLGNMKLKDIIEVRDGNGTIHVPAGAAVGLWDGWSGAGSMLEIELEQDIRVPSSIVDRIYEAYEKNGDVYGPQEIWGLTSEAYSTPLTLSGVNIKKALNRNFILLLKN